MIAILVVLAACAAPWAFGAVDASWCALLCVVCLTAAAVHALGRAAYPTAATPLPPEFRIALLLLPIPPLLGLIPLPEAVHTFLRPGGAALLAIADPSIHGAMPLSLDPGATLVAACLAASFAGTAWIVAQAARRRGIAATATGFVIATGTALAGFGLWQAATQTYPPTIYWHVPIYEIATPYGPYVNRNHFAGALEITAGVTVGAALAAFASRRHAVAVAAALCVTVQLVALAGTQSRGGVVGAVVGGLWLVGAGASTVRSRGRDWKRGALVCVGAVLVVAGILAALGMLAPLLSRIEIAPRSMNRFLIQRDALAAFAEQPLTGTGAGSFERVFPAYQAINDARSFGNAHSDWVQILMEMGVVGAAVAVFVCRAVAGIVRRGRAIASASRWAALGPCAGLVAVAVHGLFDVNLHIPANALLAVVAASLASAASLDCARGEASSSTAPPAA